MSTLAVVLVCGLLTLMMGRGAPPMAANPAGLTQSDPALAPLDSDPEDPTAATQRWRNQSRGATVPPPIHISSESVTLSFLSSNFPTKLITVSDTAIVLEEVSTTAPVRGKLAATYRAYSVVDRDEVVIESCARPGYFIVVRRDGADAHVLKLEKVTPQAAARLTYRRGMHTYVRWHSESGEELFARHQFSILKLHPKEHNALFEGDATWTAQQGASPCTDDEREAAALEQRQLIEAKARENANAVWAAMLNRNLAAHEVTTRVFMDISIGDAPARRLVIGLYGNAVPKTAYNFYKLCTGELGTAKDGLPLHFKGTKFHRVIPGFMAQGGDISRGKGGAGDSVFGGHFEDENFDMKHVGPGRLSMANYGKDTNLSQFFMSFVPLGYLDGKHVVFGLVLEGLDTLKLVEAAGTSSGVTKVPVVISDSGAM